MSLRERQLFSLKQMINLNNETERDRDRDRERERDRTCITPPCWKVLIIDNIAQDIISPLLSVKDLRELGVTLHVLLHAERDPIPEVPAVYFCAPTEENMKRITRDLADGLYDQYYFNFISPISRQKLEELAAAALHSDSVVSIRKVYDQYLNFICLEDDLFVLKHQRAEDLSYYAINRGETRDTEMENIMDSVVDSLFSLFVTLGNIPIIKSAKGNAAEMVAKKLDKKLRENYWDSRNNLFTGNTGRTGAFSFTRPLLILLDRNMDMAIPLHHTWTYQALAHDVLDLSVNRVLVNDNNPSGGAKKKSKWCDLDSNDKFWTDHKGSPFPTVAEAIQEELEKYRASEEEVKRLKNSMGLDSESDFALSMVTDNTQRLTNAVNSLPQLMEKKRLIDMHTTIATAILENIKSRRLDSFFELEEKIMSKGDVEAKLVLDLIADPAAGSPEDKMRLFIIHYICSSHFSQEDYQRFETALTNAGCDLNAMAYIKRWKGFTKMSGQYEGGGTKTVSMFSKLMSQGSSFVMEGVKNLVVKKHNLPVTRVVDGAMSGGGGGNRQGVNADAGDLLLLDPQQLRTAGAGAAAAARTTPFHEAVVFVVGGGNYIEYQNLVDFAKQKSTSNQVKIIYGASTFPNATQFLQQLSLLGQEIQ